MLLLGVCVVSGWQYACMQECYRQPTPPQMEDMYLASSGCFPGGGGGKRHLEGASRDKNSFPRLTWDRSSPGLLMDGWLQVTCNPNDCPHLDDPLGVIPYTWGVACNVSQVQDRLLSMFFLSWRNIFAIMVMLCSSGTWNFKNGCPKICINIIFTNNTIITNPSNHHSHIIHCHLTSL